MALPHGAVGLSAVCVCATFVCPDHTHLLFTLCMLGNLACFFSSTVFFFFKSTLSKISLRNTIRVSNSLNQDQAGVLSGLIWVQTVCKCYQQTTVIGNALKQKEAIKTVMFS